MKSIRGRLHAIQQEGISSWIFLVPSALLLGLFALPLAAVVWRSVTPDFFRNATSEQALDALNLSLITSSITLIIAAIFGTPLAFVLSRWKFKYKPALELMLDLPIVLPPSVAGLALLIAFGRNGLFGSALHLLGITLPFTTAAVVLAQTFVAAPLYVRSARIGFSGMDQQIIEAAHVEGASQWQLFYEVMIPLTGRVLVSGAILTWTRALGEFGATILFAGNLQGITQTMPMAIYLGFESNLGVALALSVVLMLVSAVLLLITRRLERVEEGAAASR